MVEARGDTEMEPRQGVGNVRSVVHASGPVNFFGHAHVAAWYDPAPAFVFGAMLPDFFSMLGRVRAAVTDSQLASGVAFHHATDAAFHSIPDFVERVAEARSRLSSAGVRRGAARAAAHIGVEMLLDEALAHEYEGNRAYRAALDYARTSSPKIEWVSSEDAARLHALASALAERGVPDAKLAPLSVAARIRRTLASHPRLALTEQDERLISDWVVAARPAVVGWESEILTELRSRLNAAGFCPRHAFDSARPG